MSSEVDEPDTVEFPVVAPVRLSVADILGRCAVMLGLTVPAMFLVALLMAFAAR